MLHFLSRVVLVAVSSAVVVPYTTAVLCHLLYGRQPFQRFLKRRLHPRRVYALNLTLLQSLLIRSRYASLFLRWRSYYKSADPGLLIKNLAFGRNNCCLDLHLPRSHRLTNPPTTTTPRPVVVFLYGGAWSSGDKSMYGAMLGQIAERLNVLGCVDDMIQDLVDCIQWIHDSIQDYGGDKDKLMLVGHSAGAHLGAMAILELLHDQRAHGASHPVHASMHFHDSHYGRMSSDPGAHTRDSLGESSGSSESFAVVSENGNGQDGVERMDSNASSLDSTLASMVEVSQGDVSLELKQTGPDFEASTQGPDPEPQGSQEDDNDSVVTVRPKDIERHATLVDLCSTIKAFVGLAGVYNIGDHYEHESSRGVEDYSYMTPAMYGPDHFDRFSPTCILQGLVAPISLPRMVLVHGTADYVVPISSTQKMAEVLARVSADVSVRMIPGCDHYDVCFDLMLPSRHFHSALMTILLETANRVF
ncbi:hypothetical protein BaRGS_00015471 [Batillaria attramentaria]|uniref:Uncharacterized protein n=1 Tax=Batillaria attramentaria TaxID=370345 RepID=A0ABD0L2I4_9CAEN